MAAFPVAIRVMSPIQRCATISFVALFLITSMFYLDVVPKNTLIASKIYLAHPPRPAAQQQADGHHLDHEQSQQSQFQPGSPVQDDEQSQQDSLAECESRFGRLRNLQLSENIEYTKKCIKPIYQQGGNRETVASIGSPLVGDMKNLNLKEACAVEPLEDGLGCDEIELTVSRPDPPNQGQYAHLFFGVATTFSRLRDSKHAFAHWLANSGSTLVGLVTDDNDNDDSSSDSSKPNLSTLEKDYAALGVTLKLVRKHSPQDTTEQSHMLIIQDMLSAAAPSTSTTTTATTTHWLGILDDDTFIPSLHALSTVLARHDHTKPQYLGQLTEHAGFLQMGVLAAFGGAGIFLSLALAHELEPHLDGCRRRGGGGDVQIMQCVHANSAARLMHVEGLWQTDLMGDPAGFYESGRRVLSMHHWKSWNWLPVMDMAAVSRVCGDCLLQRFIFGGIGGGGGAGAGGIEDDGGNRRGAAAVLNNGYSINIYENGVGLPDLSRTELTWDNFGGANAWADYEWSLGPLRPKVKEKKSYRLATAYQVGKGVLTQIYVHRGESEGENDEVIELVWQP